MESDENVYQVGVEFEMDAIVQGSTANHNFQYDLNETCYFEFDDNKTLEFVTKPYVWNDTTSASDSLFQDLLLAEKNLHDFYRGENMELKKAAEKTPGEGESLTINSYWPLGVPQITFQFPMHQYDRLRTFAISILPKFQECFNFKMNENLYENSKSDLEIQGLAYLCIATIKCLQKVPLVAREVGPKGCLAFMSRLSFRSMYLDLTQEQREKFNEYIETALILAEIHKKDPLFKNYTTSFGASLFSYMKDGFPVEDFINSMTQDNYNYSWESTFATEFLNIDIGNNEKDQKQIEHANREDRNTTDLLSPPPFMADDYSMGLLSRKPPKEGVLNKHFVLEFRGGTGSIFHYEFINYGKWVLRSSTDEIQTSVFSFYQLMIQSFEKLFIPNALKKMGTWDIKEISRILPDNNRNLLWGSLTIIRRHRSYKKRVIMNAYKILIPAFEGMLKDKFNEKFSTIFKSDSLPSEQIENMNDNEHTNFCSIAERLLLEYDPELSEFKKKDH